MPEMKFERDPARFDCLGLDLNRPVDSVKPGKYPFLQNVRAAQFGRLEPRRGLTRIGAIITNQSPLHSCRRLNDPARFVWARCVGVGTFLAHGQVTFAPLDSGYSGDPLAMVPWRPEGHPSSWMYVADQLRMRKIDVPGTLDRIGYLPPTVPLSPFLGPSIQKVVDVFQPSSGVPGAPVTEWVPSGTAVQPRGLDQTPEARTASTIRAILYDRGGPDNWATVALNNPNGIGFGELLDFEGEWAIVQHVSTGDVRTFIDRIIYDNLTGPGECSIVLDSRLEHIAVDSLFFNDRTDEYVRVVGVIVGPSNTTSLRVVTTSTWLANDPVAAIPSFRVFLVENHTVGSGVRTFGMRMEFTHSGGETTEVGSVLKLLSPPMDLSQYAETGPAIHREDYMCISMRVNNPLNIVEVKVQLDVNRHPPFDATQNYYTRSFRASDLSPALRHADTTTDARSKAKVNDTIDQPGILSGSGSGGADIPVGFQPPPERSEEIGLERRVDLPSAGQLAPPGQITTPSSAPQVVSQEMESGDFVWVALRFRMGDLVRVGTDDSATTTIVKSLKIVAMTTGPVIIDVDSWWIAGGYAADTGSATALPYFYRYRVRNRSTNTPSNWSPATRLGIRPLRARVILQLPPWIRPEGMTVPSAQMVYDIQRFGGELGVWHYIATVPVGSPEFSDEFPDLTVAATPSEDQTHWALWPLIYPSASGTTTAVAGTTIRAGGPLFDLAWAPGTIIRVNGVPYTIRRVLTPTLIDTEENMGSAGTGVPWQVDEPVLQGQPLPCLWGDEQLGAMFGCGDLANPGRLYFSNPHDPDTTLETSYIDITSPSEPLMNGCVYNMRSYVYSTERLFQILPTGDAVAPWRAEEIPNGHGLFARWALLRTPAPVMAALGKDGIYVSTGGAAVSITDDDLYPLFPHEGHQGVIVNEIQPPDFSPTRLSRLRLDYYDEFMYFDYLDSNGGQQSLVYQLDLGGSGGWFMDQYVTGVVFHYGEEGGGIHNVTGGGGGVHSLLCGGGVGPTADLFTMSPPTTTGDNGVPFKCHIHTAIRDQGDPRALKLYGDVMLDMDAKGVQTQATPRLDNATRLFAGTILTGDGRQQTVIPLGDQWQTGRNIGLEVEFFVGGALDVSGRAREPWCYIWEPRWTFESAPISALSWEISPTTFGMPNFKHAGIVRVTHVSPSQPIQLIFTVDGVVQPAILIQPSGGIYRQDVFRVPVMKGKLWKVRLASAAEFRLDTRDTFFNFKEWASEAPYQPLRIFGDFAMVEG